MTLDSGTILISLAISVHILEFMQIVGKAFLLKAVVVPVMLNVALDVAKVVQRSLNRLRHSADILCCS